MKSAKEKTKAELDAIEQKVMAAKEKLKAEKNKQRKI